jgi:hypothetical protein
MSYFNVIFQLSRGFIENFRTFVKDLVLDRYTAFWANVHVDVRSNPFPKELRNITKDME